MTETVLTLNPHSAPTLIYFFFLEKRKKQRSRYGPDRYVFMAILNYEI